MGEIIRNRSWKDVEKFFVENFQTEKNPPIETLLFLIGIRRIRKWETKIF